MPSRGCELLFLAAPERYLYGPIVAAVQWLSALVRPIPSGDVNLYLLYEFLALVLAYLIGAL